MMTRTAKLAVTLALASLAVPFAARAEVSDPVNVERVLTYSDYAVVTFNPDFSGTVCPSSIKKAVVIDWSADPDRKNMYAAALVAYTTAAKISFFYTGCHVWGGGVPSMLRLDLRDD